MRLPATPTALTIAGSDSGGGAGIQADLKTFTALGVFGTTAITCITAQNPKAVTAIEAVSTKLVSAQIKAVADGFTVSATKTGMLFSAGIIRAVTRALDRTECGPLTVDPVMISTSGARLLRQDAVEALFRELLPKATVITPNVDEAEILAGCRIRSLQDLTKAARMIARRFGTACVAKGGHLAGPDVIDILCLDDDLTLYSLPRVRVSNTHGTGCTFSAALTAALARGETLHDAVAIAKRYVADTLAGAVARGHTIGRNRRMTNKKCPMSK